MSNLFSRSEVALEISKDLSKKITLDNSYLDWACFNAHQSLELLLKYIIETGGLQSPKTHAINDLIIFCKETGFTYSRFNELNNLAYDINKWETKTRCGEGVKVNIDELNIVYEHISKIKEEFITYENKSSSLDRMFNSANESNNR